MNCFKQVGIFDLSELRSKTFDNPLEDGRIRSTELAIMLESEEEITAGSQPTQNGAIIACTEALTLDELYDELVQYKAVPFNLRQLFPLAFMPSFQNFKSIYALGSTRHVTTPAGNKSRAPYLFLSKTLETVIRAEQSLHGEDPVELALQKDRLRSGRDIGCDFLNEHTTKGMLIAVHT